MTFIMELNLHLAQELEKPNDYLAGGAGPRGGGATLRWEASKQLVTQVCVSYQEPHCLPSPSACKRSVTATSCQPETMQARGFCEIQFQLS